MTPTRSLRIAPGESAIARARVAATIVALLLLAAVVPVDAAHAARARTKSPTPRAGAHAAAHAMAVPFIEDDYTKALAEARARKVPIFIEAWAPW